MFTALLKETNVNKNQEEQAQQPTIPYATVGTAAVNHPQRVVRRPYRWFLRANVIFAQPLNRGDHSFLIDLRRRCSKRNQMIPKDYRVRVGYGVETQDQVAFVFRSAPARRILRKANCIVY